MKQILFFCFFNQLKVASSRGRGLKLIISQLYQLQICRLLTGAWIETRCYWSVIAMCSGRLLTGAWIETKPQHPQNRGLCRRLLTGAWIETKDLTTSPRAIPGRLLTGAWIENLLPVILISGLWGKR
ncbi:MAG: hypothetical protein D3925_06425 [Candidatus Electrothrix sp. AR5]|nr:hypothetical protein [Candidatus Electrothrix sp. AR5]